MFTGTEKLRRAGDRQTIERIQEKKELSSLRQELDEQKKARYVAELENLNTKNHNRLLTRNVETANFGMIYSWMITIIAVGLLAYVWP